MKAFIRRALCAVGLTGGVVIIGFGLAQAASADTGSGPVTTGESGIVSGNQTGADAQAPVNASGNQITVIGQRNHTTSTSTSSTSGTSGSSGSPTTSGQNGIGSGNQTAAHVQAPVNASGNQVTVIGQDNTTQSSSTTSTSGSGGSSGSPTTSGQNGGGSGNQTGVTVLAPVNVSCNQVTVIGQDNTDSCTSGSSASAPATGSPTTTGQGGIISGNQTGLGVLLPIDVSGNQVTVIGQDNTNTSTGSTSTGTTGTGGTGGTTSGPVTSGQNGIGSGNQTGIGVTAPIDISGDQITVIGQDNTNTSTGGSTTGNTGGNTSGPVTSGESGIGSGNQTGIDVIAPVTGTGNQVTVIGQDNTNTSTGGSTTGNTTGNTGGETTNGSGGVGSGNQTPIEVQGPVDTSGNQVTVIGQDNTDTTTSGSTSGGTPGGPTGSVVAPPTGATTPPSGGTATSVAAPQGSATPSSGVLPNTGLGGALPWLALLGLLLLGLGTVLTRRGGRAAQVAPGAVHAG